jgi:hypothetical protein
MSEHRLSRAAFKKLLSERAIEKLFNELGWDRPQKTDLALRVGTDTVPLKLVAEKRGFVVAVHDHAAVPDKATRQKIEKQLTKATNEHLVVYVDKDNTQQVWQLAIRRPHQPITYHEATWHKGTDPEQLFQKLSGLFIPLEAEEAITLVDVKEQVTAQFERNTKEVTKKFYREFSAQHKDFLKFIKGIQEKVDQEWYASLMLNRLMFIYFIQKKGFLNGDRDYLQNKLKESKQKRGDNKFYTFYRNFLLVLFHQGLGSPKRSAELLKEIGKVPYLNGGLFDVHELEKNHPIEVGDKAFENLFAFFDTWNWHLDTRASSTGRDVNPDVIGYIFEQYINDRAQMGAYYTKEDITEYISKNTIIPWLFDEAKRKDAQAFKPEGGVWKLLRDDPDTYIYPSVRKGITTEMVAALAAEAPDTPWHRSVLFSDLPADVRAGLDPEQKDLWKIRKAWNVRAPEDIALPTEIYRELIERRRRYLEVRRKLVAGEVTTINDLITYNLDIRQFAQDVIHEYEGSDLVGAFYDAISRITVLDPTCGSGAFLFAALGILQPLYEQCLDRMQWFVEVDNEKGSGKKHPEFRKVLDRMKQHPNRDYFIYKSIILQNLYGVDIMREAVEIAKLRLFLKLVSTVDPDPRQENYGIEPLPDIDFNIRSGNTLVGFATKAEVKGISAWSLDFDTAEQDRVEENCEKVDMAFERYKEIQLNEGEDYQTFRQAKDELHKRLAALRDELDVYLAKSYTITDLPKQQKQFEAWKASHTPFHWFAEYYGIVHQRGGFDVIIGNPPYVEYSKVQGIYRVNGYRTAATNNLYALVAERCKWLHHKQSYIGLIVPNSSISAEKMKPLQDLLLVNSACWISSFSWRPAKLFEGANMLLAIWLIGPSTRSSVNVTRYNRWFGEERDHLFALQYYVGVSRQKDSFRIPKMPSSITAQTIARYVEKSKTSTLLSGTSPGSHVLYYFRAVLYWFKVLCEPPILREDGVQTMTGEMKQLSFGTKQHRDTALCVLTSNLFAMDYVVHSSCQVVNSPDLQFPVDITDLASRHGHNLSRLADALVEDVQNNSQVQTREYSSRGRSFTMSKQYFYFKHSKPIIDEIDAVLAKYYGLSEEELDNVINYDIKYRMGDELDGDGTDDGDSAEPKATKVKPPKAAVAKQAKGETLRQAQDIKKADPDPFG